MQFKNHFLRSHSDRLLYNCRESSEDQVECFPPGHLRREIMLLKPLGCKISAVLLVAKARRSDFSALEKITKVAFYP